MLNLPKEVLLFFVSNYYDIILAVVLSIGVAFLLSKALRRGSHKADGIPGRLGLPLVGETFSFLAATNSTKGCYDFVKLRRLWHGKWFKTRLFGNIHVYVPSVEGAKTILRNDFGLFNRAYVKSMADTVGRKSLLCAPQETQKD
ncbi:unnamed protein product [Ilex paraguariensis]|uniref:Uncharacterized protein n=1 Tax=Ilex paraguariensis TaxID=185542 RepID=A0ABC8SIT9_9AQUA